MENLIEIIKEAANCSYYNFEHFQTDEKVFNIKIYDSIPDVYGAFISLSLNELLSIDTKAREIGFYLLKVSTSNTENKTYLTLTFIKL
jgi:hypothetical protein